MKSIHYPRFFHRHHRVIAAVALVGVCLLLWPAYPAKSDNFVFYFPDSHSTLAARNIKGVQYLPIIPLLNIFGHVARLRNRKKSLKIWFNGDEIELRRNEPEIRLNNKKLKLAGPAESIDGDWVVPVDFLSAALPTLIKQSVSYRTGADRVFIGNVATNSFTVSIQPLKAGTRLLFDFSAPINLRTASRNGNWVLYLGNTPVKEIKTRLSFENPYISSIQFDDSDGNPKLILTPTAPGFDFFPSLGSTKKELTAEIVKPGATFSERKPVAPPLPAQQASGTSGAPTQAQTAQQQPPSAVESPAAVSVAPPQLPAIILDAGHGGSDIGAQGKNGLLEKNLTEQLTQRTQTALLASHKYQVILTRTGDADINFDQRASAANVAHPIAFISFHAGDMGASTPRIILYVYHASSPLALAPGNASDSPFLAWDKIQLSYSGPSLAFAQQLQQDLQKPGAAGTPDIMQAPVRCLRSIAAPAVAIEVGSLAPDTDGAALTAQAFQNQIAAAVVKAVAGLSEGRH